MILPFLFYIIYREKIKNIKNQKHNKSSSMATKSNFYNPSTPEEKNASFIDNNKSKCSDTFQVLYYLIY